MKGSASQAALVLLLPNGPKYSNKKTPAAWENSSLRYLIKLIFHSGPVTVTGMKDLHFDQCIKLSLHQNISDSGLTGWEGGGGGDGVKA